MTIERYQELTGITVSSTKQAFVLAKIKKAQSILESLLGYTLDKKESQKNYYTEAGKSPVEFSLPTDDSTLLDADEVINAYRLFSYNKNDKFLMVDPFTTFNKVKLVYIRQGEDGDGITLKTFDSDEVRAQVINGFSKYIQKSEPCYNLCLCDCHVSVQLAVDASWLYDSCLPSELEYLWAEMAEYYSDPKSDIKSQTLGTHSYTKFDNTPPEQLKVNLSIIEKYAGPNGSLQSMPTE